MHFIFLLARVYPYWALPVIIVMAQLFIFFRRKQNSMKYTCVGVSALLMAGIVAWFAFRGDIHSDEWVRAWIGSS